MPTTHHAEAPRPRAVPPQPSAAPGERDEQAARLSRDLRRELVERLARLGSQRSNPADAGPDWGWELGTRPRGRG